MIKYTILLFAILLPVKFFSQAEIANPYSLTEGNLKSPQVHLLKQFADYPVDLSRGLVDITIPIYDIKFADKNIPIKLMFHPSGLKANVAENGMLGLKWALNIGGFISREVRGYPDELRPHKQDIGSTFNPDWMTLYGGTAYQIHNQNNFIYSSHDLGNYFGYTYDGVYGTYEDTEYDIFTFSLPNGESGKFILEDNNGDKSAQFMPYKPYKLNNPLVESIYYLEKSYTRFEITDDEGYTYVFGKRDSNKSYYENAPDYNYINCWLLNSIISPNKQDTITFDYISRSIHANSPSIPVIINDNLENFVDYYSQESCQGVTDNSALFNALESILYESSGYLEENYNEPPYMDDNTHYLSKITYNDLSIDFVYEENSADINDLLLNKIEISNDNKTIRKVGFDVESPGGGTPTSYEKPSYLNAVSIMGSTDAVIEQYSFDYYYLNKLPSMDKLGNKADYWGYYQSQVANRILQETVDIHWMNPSCTSNIEQRLQEVIGSGTNRYSNPEDMKIGMVKSITYPTGGTTTFEYDGNKYMDGSTVRECGGLRIKSIIHKDENGNDLKKRKFTYGQNEDGIGEVPIYLKPFPSVLNSFEETATTYYIEDNAGPFPDPDVEYGTYTTRYITGLFPGNFYTFLYDLVSYDKVTEYNGDHNNNIGKIEYYYATNTPLRTYYEFNNNNFRYKNDKPIIDPSGFWRGNHLSKKIEYKIENELYSKVKQIDYSYQSRILDEFYDLSIFKFKNFVGFATSSGEHSTRTALEELNQVKNYTDEFFGHKVQTYTVGTENLSKITEELYFNNGNSIIQTTINKYDTDKPRYLRESIIINSKGDSVSHKYLYPFDINTGVYGQMTVSNVISPIVEKISLSKGIVTNSALLTYKKSDNNFVPDKNYVAELTTPISYSNFNTFTGLTKDSHYNSIPENTYDSYDDYGNLTQITSKGEITTCYIWGYDKKYPIAKIENATYSQVAGKVANLQNLSNTDDDHCLDSGNCNEKNLRVALTNLRNSLPNAMVTTYTYDPLVGITSITTSDGYTTYYEYDEFNRLEYTRDAEGKILSENEYHYKNQQ